MSTPRSLRFDSPTHVVLRSASPAAAEFAGYLLASRVPQGFALLEIRPGPFGAPDPPGSPWDPLVAPERHMITFAPTEGRSADRSKGATDWPIVRADAPDRVISHLPEFLASPEAASQALRQKLPLRESLPILITNGGLVARAFPDDPTITARLMKVQKAFGLSVVLAADETPRHDYASFDFEFEVLPSNEGWAMTRMRCVRATPDSELRGGDDVSFRELDGFDSTVSKWSAVRPPQPADPDPGPGARPVGVGT